MHIRSKRRGLSHRRPQSIQRRRREMFLEPLERRDLLANIVTITANKSFVNEGATWLSPSNTFVPQTLILSATRAGDTLDAVEIAFATQSGTATYGTDYTYSGVFTFAAGATSSSTNVTLQITDDNESENLETIGLWAPTTGANCQATFSTFIVDDDNPLYKKQERSCNCPCNCSDVTAQANRHNGTVRANNPTTNLGYRSQSRQSPIIGGPVELSSGVASADIIEVIPVFNEIVGTSVFYDPSALSGGVTGEFLAAADTVGLPTGHYSWGMQVIEHYTGSPDVVHYIAGQRDLYREEHSEFGSGWGGNDVDRLFVQDNGAGIAQGDGNIIWFWLDGSDYVRDSGSPIALELEDLGGGDYELTAPDGTVSLFTNGLLISREDRQGNVTNYEYTDADGDSVDDEVEEISDPYGRVRTFTYYAGLLDTVTDESGRVTGFTFNGSGELEVITEQDPDGAGALTTQSTTFDYDADALLTTITNDDNEDISFEYDGNGRAKATNYPGSATEAYQPALYYGVVDPDSTLGTSTNPAPVPLSDEAFGTFTDRLGNVTTYVTDGLGLPVEITDYDGNVTTFERDQDGRVTLLTEPDPDGAGALTAPITEYEYDAVGNLLSIDYPDSTSEIWTYDTDFNVPLTYIDRREHLTVYVIHPVTGLVEEIQQVIGELDDLVNLETDDIVTEFTYYGTPTYSTDPPAGMLASVEDALGRITEYEYDGHGNLTLIRYAAGTADEAEVEFEYDAYDRLITQIDELDRETAFVYDAYGRVEEVTYPDPDGAGPLASPVVTSVYNNLNQLITTIDPLTRETAYTYDARGNQTQVDLPDHDGDTYVTSTIYAYNAGDQVESVTDPLGRVTSFLYDIHGRVTQTTLPDPDGVGGVSSPVTATTYDNLGRVISQTDALDQVTTYAYANFGREVTITLPDPDGAGTLYTAPQLYQEYDATGNLIEAHDANGNITLYEYDELNRLISVTTPDPDEGGPLTAMSTTYEYDKVGNLRFVTDTVGNVTEYVYDSRNRKTEVIQPDPDGTGSLSSPVTEYEYDLAGQLVSMTDPLDRVTAYDYDGLGRLILVTLPDPDGVGGASSPEISYTYDVAGRKLTMTDARGKVTSYDYDLLDNLVELTQPDPDGAGALTSPVSQWVYDAAGQLLEAIDPLGHVTTYDYDFLGRLLTLTAPDPDGAGAQDSPVTTYTYDANGNRLTVSDPLSHVTEYAYDYLNRVSSVEDALAGVTSFTYDSNGNRLTLTDPEANTTTWTYDKLNRVITEQNELAESRLFAYDQMGNLRMRTDRLDRVYVLSYDNLHRQTREDWWQIENFPTVTVDETTAGSKTNEVQQVGFSDSTAFISGTFTLTYSGQTTSAIAWDADEATVDAALEALSNIGAGDVSVAKSTNLDTEQVWTVTFTGALAATNVAQITIDASSVYNGVGAPTELETTDTTGSKINEEQTVTLSGATAGYYRLLLNGYYTAPIAYDASAGSVETALEALTNIDDVTVTGSTGGPYTITFGGTQSGINVSTLTWRPADTDPLANSDFVGSLLYEYDAAGQMTDAFYQDGSLEGIAGNFFTYDGLGRVTNETMMFGGYDDTITLDQQYDAGGNRTQALWSFGTTEQFTSDYTYDALNRLTELTRSSDEQADYWHRAQFSYNKLGQFLGISRFVGDGTTPIGVADTDFTYDDLSRLVSIEHFTGGTTWAGYDYTYDDASRITSIDSYLDGLSEYTHDDTNQLTSADHTGSTDETYTYDANGNRTMSGYTTGDNNQLTSDGVFNYTYDAEGNRLARTNISTGYVTEYTWDHRNRLTKVTEKDDMDNVLSTVEHSYDAFNRWIRRSADADGPGGSYPVETIFAYDGNQLSLEFTDSDGVDLDGDDLSHVYTWGPTVDQLLVDFTDGDVPQWALTDHLGTVRDFIEYDAGMTDTVDTGHRIFDSFGNITSQTGILSMIGFTGRPFDETTGLQNNLNRWYDPLVGRWVSEDPIGFAGGDTNVARYVGNTPTTNIDPTGLADFIDGPNGTLYHPSLGTYSGPNADKYPNRVVVPVKERPTLTIISTKDPSFINKPGNWLDRYSKSPLAPCSRFEKADRIADLHKIIISHKPGTVSTLVVMGHGISGSSGAGFIASDFSYEWLKNNPKLVADIQALLSKGGVLIIISCNNNVIATQKISDLLNIPIIVADRIPGNWDDNKKDWVNCGWDKDKWDGYVLVRPGDLPEYFVGGVSVGSKLPPTPPKVDVLPGEEQMLRGIFR